MVRSAWWFFSTANIITCQAKKTTCYIFYFFGWMIAKKGLAFSSDTIMGNVTSDKNWAAQERLRFIERCAWWRGVVNRRDLAEVFGVSMAQASSDLQKYGEMNPGSLIYDVKGKKYDGAGNMRLLYGVASLADVMGMWLRDDAVALLGEAMPTRMADAVVLRHAMMATLRGQKLRVKYHSLSSGGLRWREFMPLRWVNSGLRWHVRAWCFTNEDWRDFTVSRIEKTELPMVKVAQELPTDTEWERMVVLRLRPNGALPAEKAAGVMQDFRMVDGVLELPVRAALEGYVRSMLGLPHVDGTAFMPLVEDV